eukprot:scaffold12.g8170.t1
MADDGAQPSGGEEAPPQQQQQDGPAVASNGATKLTAAQKKRLKAKQRKQAKKAEREAAKSEAKGEPDEPAAKKKPEVEEVEIEYVSAPLEFELGGSGGAAGGDQEMGDAGAAPMPAEEELRRILERFGTVEQLLGGEGGAGEGGAGGDDAGGGEEGGGGGEAGGEEKDKGEGSEDEEDEEDKLSKKKRKMATRLKIAELKQARARTGGACERPDVVEVWDVTAADPKLLVFLKAYRNTVPVPRHWSQKRKYLQGKRGLEKPPFKLPDFIEATGIGEMRQARFLRRPVPRVLWESRPAYLEKAESQKLKQKARERMQPKMGKLDIDYQVLHDAFFKYQSKPQLSGLGDLYYEGKEFESVAKHARPGVLSPELQAALGMEEGMPPPWLINMQRYGPPPSYPSLKIPGLNAPIPPGSQFGYHPGGWGKPPVDEVGNPVYGDVFGQHLNDLDEDELAVDRTVRWGDLEEEEEEESEEEEEEEEEEDADEAASLADGYASVASGMVSSLPSGLDTPSEIDLRKGTASEAPSVAPGPRQLYTVLEQQKAAVGAGLMGSDHTYVIPGSGGGEKKAGGGLGLAAAKRLEALRREMPSDVEVALDPTELEGLDDEALRSLYEARLAEQRAAAGREDFSDLVAAKAAQQKRKAAEAKATKDSKRYKF